MNISTLAKTLGVSVNELRKIANKNKIPNFWGRNTRIPYKSAVAITKIVRPEKATKLKNDDRIYIPATVKVQDFAEAIGKPPGLVVQNLVLNGIIVTLNEKIDYDTASLIAEEMGVKIHPDKNQQEESAEDYSKLNLIQTFASDKGAKLVDRPPVVTIMGHVDHGKTTLLDTIRKSNVASGEAGSITQHISSYQVQHKKRKITFVDTPGHEAFTAMRARGTQLADFVILVVSATEGPKPQTVEVIERAKISNTPIIVAINKIDLPEADIEKVKTDLTKFGLLPEEWGGENHFIPISAKTKEGLEKLLDTIFLLSDVAELKGQAEGLGRGVVIESHKDPKLGIVSTILVTKGKFRVGDIIRCGTDITKVKKMEDSNSKNISQADLTKPVMLLGLNQVATSGQQIYAYANKKDAQNQANIELAKKKNTKVSYFGTQNEKGCLNLILKADVNGSLEAIKESILKIKQEDTKIRITQESVGDLTENDIEFAKTTGSSILAFHVSAKGNVDTMLRNYKVNLIQSDIIYEILNWVETEILKNVKHEIKYESLGKAEVLATFKSDKPNLQIVGGEVKQGKIFDNKNLRVWRKQEFLGVMEVASLQRNKDDSKEIFINQQFGIGVVGKVKLEVGDVIESVEEIIVN